MARVNQLRESNATLANLVTIVNQLCTRCDDIDNKMETAVLAMTELAALFSAMGTYYDNIVINLTGMATGVKSDSATARRLYINDKMSLAINKLTLVRPLRFHIMVHTANHGDIASGPGRRVCRRRYPKSLPDWHQSLKGNDVYLPGFLVPFLLRAVSSERLSVLLGG
jgi:hypothetical protein